MQGLRSSKVKGDETNGMNQDVTCTWGSRGVRANQKLLKVIIFSQQVLIRQKEGG